jgi:sulfate adenylyltransferase subunit 1
MFTGASNADLAILLVDARHGVTEQTRRHSIIAAILGIPHIVLCVNKMDLINYDQTQYDQIVSDFKHFSDKLSNYGGLKDITCIPTSAMLGDNVVNLSENMSWYKGPSLFEFLETVELENNAAQEASRFQVQYVIRPQTDELHDYRGYAGSVLSGKLRVGQQVVIYPDELYTEISKIEINQQEKEEATAGQPIILHLKDDLDVSRGCMIVPVSDTIDSTNQLAATVCWMDNKPYQDGQSLIIQQGAFRTKASIKNVTSSINIHTNEKEPYTGTIKLNDFCNIELKTAENISFDVYKNNRRTGAFILINENTNNTVAAGVFHE